VKILQIGCGKNKNPNNIGLDINPISNADIIHDLNIFPYPFKDNEFDEILATSIIEHLDDIIAVMREIHRICKPGGVVKILVPFFASWTAFTDPTHKHCFGIHSFDYFIKGKPLSRYSYSDFSFNLKEVRYQKGCGGRLRFLDKFILWFANHFKDSYENRFAFIIPVEDIYFELEVIK